VFLNFSTENKQKNTFVIFRIAFQKMPYLFCYHGTQKNNKIYIKHNEKKQQTMSSLGEHFIALGRYSGLFRWIRPPAIWRNIAAAALASLAPAAQRVIAPPAAAGVSWRRLTSALFPLTRGAGEEGGFRGPILRILTGLLLVL
jgi:hypothetical protein